MDGLIEQDNILNLSHEQTVDVPPHTEEPDGLQNHCNWQHPCGAHPVIVNADLGIVEVAPRRKRVALVGYAASTRHLAPYNDPDCEIWGLNQLNRWIPRADRWFEIHYNWNEHVVEGTDYETFLKTLPIPVYMSTRIPEIPTSVQYPKDAIVKEFGIEYLTSSIAEMIALAIYVGFEEIGLYGIDLVVGDEWSYQKPCAEFWLGVAHAKGIHVHLPHSSALLKSRYSYGYEPSVQLPLPNERLRERLKKCREEIAILKDKMNTLNGAAQIIESVIYAQEVWEHGGDTTIF